MVEKSQEKSPAMAVGDSALMDGGGWQRQQQLLELLLAEWRLVRATLDLVHRYKAIKGGARSPMVEFRRRRRFTTE